MSIIIGLDPGLGGALALLDIKGGHLAIMPIPTVQMRTGGTAKGGKRAIDLATLSTLLGAIAPAVVHVGYEDVHAMPGQGVTSMFQFGRSLGQVEGIFAAFQMPVTPVRPADWKRALQVPAAKEAARGRASQLMPRCATLWPKSSDDGKAEAALIALYQARLLGLGLDLVVTPALFPLSAPQGGQSAGAVPL